MSGRPVARVGDFHTCPASNGPVPHVGGPIISGSPNVIIAGQPAARLGDQAVCFGGGIDSIISGSSTVKVNGLPAALMGDFTAHGGVVIAGAPNVVVGDVFVPAPVNNIAASLASAAAASITPNALAAGIGMGSTGPKVAELQKTLAAAGYAIKVDGIWGPKTEAAYKDYQTKQAGSSASSQNTPTSSPKTTPSASTTPTQTPTGASNPTAKSEPAKPEPAAPATASAPAASPVPASTKPSPSTADDSKLTLENALEEGWVEIRADQRRELLKVLQQMEAHHIKYPPSADGSRYLNYLGPDGFPTRMDCGASVHFAMNRAGMKIDYTSTDDFERTQQQRRAKGLSHYVRISFDKVTVGDVGVVKRNAVPGKPGHMLFVAPPSNDRAGPNTRIYSTHTSTIFRINYFDNYEEKMGRDLYYTWWRYVQK